MALYYGAILLALILINASTCCEGFPGSFATSIPIPSDTATSSGAVNKLHLQQQAAKTRRAELEKTLLLPGLELLPPILKAADKKDAVKAGTGFGSNKSSPKLQAAKSMAKILRTEGVIRINNCLSPSIASNLREFALRGVRVAKERIGQGEVLARSVLGMELERKCRNEFLLPLAETIGEEGDTSSLRAVADALNELIGDNGSLRELFEIMVTKSGILYDLAAMMTEPGSDRQAMHADMPFHSDPPLYSIFCALQDVTFDMGPTVFLPGTISTKEQKEWNDTTNRDNFMRSHTPYFALLKAGDLVMYDPRVLHCGSANDEKLGSSRVIFNLGFRNPIFKGNMGYRGALRPTYSDNITLGDIMSKLSAYSSKSALDPLSSFGDGLNLKTSLNL